MPKNELDSTASLVSNETTSSDHTRKRLKGRLLELHLWAASGNTYREVKEKPNFSLNEHFRKYMNPADDNDASYSRNVDYHLLYVASNFSIANLMYQM